MRERERDINRLKGEERDRQAITKRKNEGKGR